MSAPDAPRQTNGMTPRVLLLAAVLTPLNGYWIAKTEVVWAFVHATVLSLFFNVIGCLFLITLLNRAVRRVRPAAAFSGAELVSLYVLLCAATAIFGHDLTQVLSNMLLYPVWKAAAGSPWSAAFQQHVPAWMAVQDREALRGAWLGDSTLYTVQHLRAWATPVAVWLGFLIVLIWTMLCASSLLRRRWTEHERLAFPLVQIPSELLLHSDRLLGNRLFWIAFLLAGGLDLWNAAAKVWPSVPGLSLRSDLMLFLTSRPWSDMGFTPVTLYPFAVGLTFFMPLDLSFSAWFFFWIWKLQMVARSAMGYEPMSGAYMGDQSAGAWLGIGFMAIWGLRSHLASVVRIALGDQRRSEDAGEPMRYRTALAGMVAGMAALTAFGVAAGLSIWVAIGFNALYFVICATVTRMRAEFGPATHDLYFSGPERMMTSLAGPGAFSTRDLSALTQFHWLTRDFRSHPMPHQLEGFRLGSEAGARLRSFVLPILAISAWAFVVWFWCYLHIMYQRGAIVRVAQPGTGWTFLAGEAYQRLDGWLGASNRGPDIRVWQQMGGGLGLTVGLLLLRQRFSAFALHPVGYALAGSWTMSWLWFSVLIGWALKGILMRYGGVRAYRRVTPFFVGLVVGECVAGGGLSLLNALTDQITYGFFP